MIRNDPNERIELDSVIEIIEECKDQPDEKTSRQYEYHTSSSPTRLTYNRRPQDVMGRGSNGPVYWGRYNGVKVAIKASCEWEEKVLRTLDHQGIVKLLYAEDGVNKRYFDLNQQILCLTSDLE